MSISTSYHAMPMIHLYSIHPLHMQEPNNSHIAIHTPTYTD